MPRVRIVHWKVLEAPPLIEACRACGFEIEYDDVKFPVLAKMIREKPPDVLVIDLTCLPSHGRESAVYLRRTKYARHIPIVFVDGEPEKVAATRQLLPDATYTTRKNVGSRIKSALAKKPENPVLPPDPLVRYAGRTVAQKLGVREGVSVGVINAPRNYAAAIGELPEGAEFVEDPASVCAVTLWFVGDSREYQAVLRRMTAIAGKTRLWVIWRKASFQKAPRSSKKAGGLSDKLVREGAIEAGLVDYKICAVNEEWSGMALALRKS